MDLFANINMMSKLLDVKLKRHELISNNLANVDTPGYKRMDISFEEILKNVNDKKSLKLAVTNERHISNIKEQNIQPRIYREQDYSLRNDGNNVDIDKEMVEMLKNTYSYNIISDQVQRNLGMLRTAINEGR